MLAPAEVGKVGELLPEARIKPQDLVHDPLCYLFTLFTRIFTLVFVGIYLGVSTTFISMDCFAFTLSISEDLHNAIRIIVHVLTTFDPGPFFSLHVDCVDVVSSIPSFARAIGIGVVELDVDANSIIS